MGHFPWGDVDLVGVNRVFEISEVQDIWSKTAGVH